MYLVWIICFGLKKMFGLVHALNCVRASKTEVPLDEAILHGVIYFDADTNIL